MSSSPAVEAGDLGGWRKSPKKWLKRPGARVGLWWNGYRKQPPKGDELLTRSRLHNVRFQRLVDETSSR